MHINKTEFDEFKTTIKDKLIQLKKDKKTSEELLAQKEKDLIEVKSQILQYEEKALQHQHELLNYKRDTEAKILLLQTRYNEELSRISTEK